MSLDERMRAAGMMPLSEMLEKSPLGKFSAHAGVTDLASFEAVSYTHLTLPTIYSV